MIHFFTQFPQFLKNLYKVHISCYKNLAIIIETFQFYPSLQLLKIWKKKPNIYEIGFQTNMIFSTKYFDTKFNKYKLYNEKN